MALRYHAQCLFRLDQWDGVIALEEKRHGLEQRYTNFQERSGPVSFHIALMSSVHALRGEVEKSSELRDESVRIMSAADGPTERWGRDNLY